MAAVWTAGQVTVRASKSMMKSSLVNPPGTAARSGGADEAWITHAGVARCVHWLLQTPAGAWPSASDWSMPAPSFGAWQAWEI